MERGVDGGRVRMRQPVIDPILRRHPVAWEGACEITGIAADAAASHWLSVTEEGHLALYHGPAGHAPAWTHAAPAPHSPGTILARWEPSGYEFTFRFDRN